LAKALIEVNVADHGIADARASKRGKFVVEVDSKLAEVLVIRVSKRKHGVGEILAARKVFKAELLVEGADSIGCFTVTIRTGDDDGIAFRDERGGGVALERMKRGDVPFALEVFGDFASHTLGSSGLRGIENGDLEREWRIGGRRHNWNG
jgi:hypothetical protein